MTGSRCTYCGKKCPEDYCCEECRSKGEAYFEKLSELSDLKNRKTRLILLCVMIYTAIIVLVCIRDYKYIGVALLPFGIFMLFWPYVNNDTMKFMSIRTGKLILKIVGVIWTAMCIVGSVMALS